MTHDDFIDRTLADTRTVKRVIGIDMRTASAFIPSIFSLLAREYFTRPYDDFHLKSSTINEVKSLKPNKHDNTFTS